MITYLPNVGDRVSIAHASLPGVYVVTGVHAVFTNVSPVAENTAGHANFSFGVKPQDLRLIGRGERA